MSKKYSLTAFDAPKNAFSLPVSVSNYLIKNDIVKLAAEDEVDDVLACLLAAFDGSNGAYAWPEPSNDALVLCAMNHRPALQISLETLSKILGRPAHNYSTNGKAGKKVVIPTNSEAFQKIVKSGTANQKILNAIHELSS